MLSDDDIREALRACFDPELPLDIVELGLVRAVVLTVDEEAPGYGIVGVPVRQRVRLELAPTSDDEGRRAQLRAQVENLLGGVSQISRAEVIWVEEPAWTPAQITPRGLRILGLDRFPKTTALLPILNNRPLLTREEP